MGKTTERVLRQYLEKAGSLRLVELGEEPEDVAGARAPEPDELIRFVERQSRFQNMLAVVMVVMLCVIFLVGVVAAVRGLNTFFAAGGTLALLLGVVASLHRVWVEKVALDLVLYAIRNLPPEEVVRVIETVYWNLVRRLYRRSSGHENE